MEKQIAQQIILLRTALLQGNFGVVEQLRERFEKNKDKVPVAGVQEGNEDEDSEGGGEGNGEEMGDADGGVLPASPELAGSIVDEDGFELVQSRRWR